MIFLAAMVHSFARYRLCTLMIFDVHPLFLLAEAVVHYSPSPWISNWIFDPQFFWFSSFNLISFRHGFHGSKGRFRCSRSPGGSAPISPMLSGTIRHYVASKIPGKPNVPIVLRTLSRLCPLFFGHWLVCTILGIWFLGVFMALYRYLQHFYGHFWRWSAFFCVRIAKCHNHGLLGQVAWNNRQLWLSRIFED